MESKIKLLEKLIYIGGSNIPVSENNRLYHTFFKRRELARRMQTQISREEFKLLEQNLEYIEDIIRKELFL